jgi:hypothetical protein
MKMQEDAPVIPRPACALITRRHSQLVSSALIPHGCLQAAMSSGLGDAVAAQLEAFPQPEPEARDAPPEQLAPGLCAPLLAADPAADGPGASLTSPTQLTHFAWVLGHFQGLLLRPAGRSAGSYSTSETEESSFRRVARRTVECDRALVSAHPEELCLCILHLLVKHPQSRLRDIGQGWGHIMQGRRTPLGPSDAISIPGATGAAILVPKLALPSSMSPMNTRGASLLPTSVPADAWAYACESGPAGCPGGLTRSTRRDLASQASGSAASAEAPGGLLRTHSPAFATPPHSFREDSEDSPVHVPPSTTHHG